MTQIYVVRHGETEYNAKGLYYGWTDCELTEKGIAQGEELKQSFSEIAFDYVIASPLKRTMNTAELISGFKSREIILDERLKELNFGQWEGLHHTEISNRYNADWVQWGRDWKSFKIPDGESFIEFFERVRSCIDELKHRYEGKRILLVTHHGCMRVIPLVLLDAPMELYWSLAFEHGRYSLFEISHGQCIIRKINSK